jgi:hypothetical protein
LVFSGFWGFGSSPTPFDILKTGWSFTFKIPKRLTGKLFFAQANDKQNRKIGEYESVSETAHRRCSAVRFTTCSMYLNSPCDG